MGWLDHDRVNSYVLTQHDWDGTLLGTLNGFITGSVTKEYYSDMRSIASIETVNDNYITNALIKITITTNKGDSASLGVFCVANVNATYFEDGTVRRTYDLKSIIYKMQNNLFSGNYVLQGTKTFGSILDAISESANYVKYYTYSTARARTHEFSAEGAVYNAGSSVYSMFSDVSDKFNIRMSVYEHYAHFDVYVKPKDMGVDFTFNQSNGSICGEIRVKPMKYETPNDVIVTCTSNDITLYGRATLPSSDPQSPYSIKRWNGVSYSENDISPATQARANEIAQKHLKEISNPNDEFEWNGQFVGLTPDRGCCVYVQTYNSSGVFANHKCLVKSMAVTLDAAASTSYTAKVVNQNE